jgi:hypothetical protein
MGQIAVCCQNLPLGAFSSKLFKKFGLFFQHAEIQENVIRELCAITESVFLEAFQQWEKRWERCIASRGDYFEGQCLKCCKIKSYSNLFLNMPCMLSAKRILKTTGM